MADLTLEDIAKKVGVSRSTVSRVVNDSPNVSPAVRERVMREIKATGFHPNAAARSLASQHTNMVGLVLPQSVSSFFTDPYFPFLTQGVAFGCNNNDLTLSLFLVGNKEDEEKIYPRISRRGLLDGVLLQAGAMGDWLIDRLSNSSVPTVILGRPFEPESVNYIDVDNLAAAENAVCHLVNLGYKKIATITGNPGSAVTMDRLEGYRRALAKAGRPMDNNLIAQGEFTETSGYQAMKQILPHHPDALFSASDIMAAGAMRAIFETGLRVPEDIAIVGFDDIPMAANYQVPLTTVRQPIVRMGLNAVDLLMDVIANGGEPVRHVILETEFIIRASCGAGKK